MKSRQSTMRTMLVLLSLCAITGVGIGGLRAAAPSDMPSLSLVVDTLIADATTAEDAPETAWASFHREGLVVWQVLGNMGRSGISLQRVDSSMAPLGSTVELVAASGSARRPAVAYSPESDCYLVVWEDGDLLGFGDSTVRGCVISRWNLARDDGVGAPFDLSEEEDAGSPRVTSDAASGGFVVVWSQAPSWVGPKADTSSRIMARRYTPSDILRRSPIEVAEGDVHAPDIASLGEGAASGFLVVWEQRGERMGDNRVYGRLLGADGRLLARPPTETEPFEIAGARYTASNPRVSGSPTSASYFVVWGERERSTADSRGVRGRGITDDGSLVGSETVLSTTDQADGPSIDHWPSVDAYAVAWHGHNDGEETKATWRAVGTDGTTLTTPSALPAGSVSGEYRPALACDTGANVLAAWVDNRDAGAGQGANIYGRIVALNRFAGTVRRQLGEFQLNTPDVEVLLKCAATSLDKGVTIASMTTLGDGSYALPFLQTCNYYRIVLVVPEGYEAVGATSVGGTVKSDTVIEYTSPLSKAPRDGNDFVITVAQPTATPTASATPSPTPDGGPALWLPLIANE